MTNKNTQRMRFLCLILAVLLLAGCAVQGDPTTEPTSEPTTAPTTEPTTAPTTEPTEPPPTEPVMIAPTTEPTTPPTTAPTEPDQSVEGERKLTEKELQGYTNMFFQAHWDNQARHPENYYNQALQFTFSDPRTILMEEFFCQGFLYDEHKEPYTDEEWAFIEENIGDRSWIGAIDRLPADMVDQVLNYFFGISMEDVDEDARASLKYNEDTDAYYFDPPGGVFYGEVTFIDGYYDPETKIVRLYYIRSHYTQAEDTLYVVTLQSKNVVREYGYYILSNLPAEEG